MKTNELIKKLQELDPSGEKEVLITVYSCPSKIDSVEREDVRAGIGYGGFEYYNWNSPGTNAHGQWNPLKSMIIIAPEETE